MHPVDFPYIDDFCDDEVYVFSTMGQGPKGDQGDKGDASTDEQTYNAVSQFIENHPEYVTTIEDGAVTTPKIADGAVTAPKLAGNAIPTMSRSTKGIAKVGAGLAMNGEALELDGNGDIATAVESWLDAHPEATTTVQDDSITARKLVDGEVTDRKLAGAGVRGISEDFLAEFVDLDITRTWRNGLSLPYRGMSTIDISVSDGTIHVAGTTTSNFVAQVAIGITGVDSITVSGCPSGGSDSTYHIGVYITNGPIIAREVGNGLTVPLDPTLTYWVGVVVLSGTTIDKTFRPRVRTGKMLDVIGTVDRLDVEVGDITDRVDGNVYDLSTLADSTINGVKFTVDSTSGTITAVGTAMSNALYYMGKFSGVGYVEVEGCPEGGASATYNLALYDTYCLPNIRVKYDVGSGFGAELDQTHEYNTAIVVFSGQTVDLTFRPRVYTGRLMDLENKVDKLINAKPRIDGIYSDPVFMWVGAGTLHIYVAYSAGMIYDGIVQSSIREQHYVLEIPSTIRLVVYDGEFKVVQLNQVTSEHHLMGWVYNGTVKPIADNVIVNHPPLLQLKQREDVETHIVFDRLGYRLVPTFVGGSSGDTKWFGDSVSVKNGYSGNGLLQFFDEATNMTKSMTTNVVQNTSSLSGKKILCIGDSITNRGWYQDRIDSYDSGLVFVGTRTCQYSNLKSEGYSGMKARWFSTSESPFYNPQTETFDFEYYCTQNDIEADIVVMEFGLNETDNAATFTATIQAMINSIKAYDQSINVFMCIPFRMSLSPFANGLGSNMGRYFNIQSLACGCSDLTDCELIPTHIVLNDRHDYEPAQIDYGYGSLTLDGTNDPVHPSESIGFQKLGDVIYNYIY